jgi:hypothetical protein
MPTGLDGAKSDRSGNGMTAVEGGAPQSNDGTVERAGSQGQDGQERDIPSEEARHGTTLVAESLRASV